MQSLISVYTATWCNIYYVYKGKQIDIHAVVYSCRHAGSDLHYIAKIIKNHLKICRASVKNLSSLGHMDKAGIYFKLGLNINFYYS